MSIYYDDTADIETVKLDQNEETLSGTKTLVTTDKVVQKLDPNGASRDVTLPAITNDLMFIVHNSGTVAGFNLVVKNPAGTILGTLRPGMSGVFHCGAAWKYLDDSGFSYEKLTKKIRFSNTLDGMAIIFSHNDVSGGSIRNGGLGLDFNNAAGTATYARIDNAGNIFLGSPTNYDFYFSRGAIQIGIKTSPTYTLDVNGAINSRVYHKCEDFDEEAAGVQLEAGLKADEWTGGGTNYASANVTYTGAVNGEVQILTTAADDDSAFIMGLPQQAIDNDPIFETRFKMTNITNGFCGVGLVEGLFVDKATYDDDICIVGIDSDNAHGFGADRLILITNDNNAGAIIDDLGVDLVAGTYVKVKLDLTDTEQPRVWINDTEIAAGSITGTVQAGISMANYGMAQALSAAADTLTIDYFKNWNSR